MQIKRTKVLEQLGLHIDKSLVTSQVGEIRRGRGLGVPKREKGKSKDLGVRIRNAQHGGGNTGTDTESKRVRVRYSDTRRDQEGEKKELE
jgi:hypothetical protein